MVMEMDQAIPKILTDNLKLLSNRYILSPVGSEKFTSSLEIRRKVREQASLERYESHFNKDSTNTNKSRIDFEGDGIRVPKLTTHLTFLPKRNIWAMVENEDIPASLVVDETHKKMNKLDSRTALRDYVRTKGSELHKNPKKTDEKSRARNNKTVDKVPKEEEEEIIPKITTNLKLLSNRYILSAVGSEKFTSHRELRKAMREKNDTLRNEPHVDVVIAKDDKLREKLLAGLHNVRIPTEMMRTGFKRVTFLPVSTRGVGFYVQYLFGKFGRLICSHQIDASPYQLYRLSLMQLEYRLCKVMGLQKEMCNNYDLLPSKTLDMDYQITAKNMPFNISPIANLVMSVGNFQLHDKTYYPIIAPHITDEKGRFIPEPTTVTFSNLRKVVEYLSDPLTDKKIRQMFYDHSPLPCASWGPKPILERRPNGTPFERQHHDFPLLLNPDDFITKDYYQQQTVKTDVQNVTELFTNIERKYPKLISSCEIDYKSDGCPSLLTSNKLENLRNQDVSFISGKPDLSSIKIGFDGEIGGFWSPEVTSGEHLCLGGIKLLGEQRLHSPPKYLEKAYAVRAETAASYVVSFSYTTILRLMTNELLT